MAAYGKTKVRNSPLPIFGIVKNSSCGMSVSKKRTARTTKLCVTSTTASSLCAARRRRKPAAVRRTTARVVSPPSGAALLVIHDMQTFDAHLYHGIRDCRAGAAGPEQNDFAERTIATGFFNAGTNIGAMVTPMLIPLILTVWGWQVAFYAMGATGLVWLMFWLKAYYDPDSHPGVSKAELDYIHQGAEPAAPKVPISKVLRLRATWAYAAGAALSMPVFWFYLYWLPSYLNKQYHLGISVVQMGLPLIVIYLTADLGSVLGGVLSSAMIGRRMAPIPKSTRQAHCRIFSNSATALC
jgi:hypothetical protein